MFFFFIRAGIQTYLQDGELYNLGNGVRWGTEQKALPVKPTNTQIKIIN